jgi:hypothetical protein
MPVSEVVQPDHHPRELSTHEIAVVLDVNQSTVSRDLSAAEDTPSSDGASGVSEASPHAHSDTGDDRPASLTPESDPHAQEPAAERAAEPADPFGETDPDDDLEDQEAAPASTVPPASPHARRPPIQTHFTSAVPPIDPGISPELDDLDERLAAANRAAAALRQEPARRKAAERSARLEAYDREQLATWGADQAAAELDRAYAELRAAILADRVNAAVLNVQDTQQRVASEARTIEGIATRLGEDVDTGSLAFAVGPVPLDLIRDRVFIEKVDRRKADRAAAAEVRRQAAAGGITDV